MTMFHESEWACAGLENIEPLPSINVLSQTYLPRWKKLVLEFLLRFIAGGGAVSAFAALGDILRPKSFAGLFGAAPSIALATILITLWKKGALFVAVEGRSMIVGAFALAAYSWTVCILLKKFMMSSWTATTLALVAWFVVAFGITSIFFAIQ
jgi:hypothetical protein